MDLLRLLFSRHIAPTAAPIRGSKSFQAKVNPNHSKTEETQMKRILLICLALLAIASLSARAQDSASRTITINGGQNSVYMGTTEPTHSMNRIHCIGFQDNICGHGYVAKIGWTVSDGSPVNFEWSPANQFKSGKSGTTKKITVGLGFIQGTNATLIELIEDCENKPCTNPDGLPKSKQLCHGTVKNMPTFGTTGTTVVSFKCVAKLVKDKNYWVLMQSPANSWLAWNTSNVAMGLGYFGENDKWVKAGTQPMGALTVQ
jgi:hypothetical protein